MNKVFKILVLTGIVILGLSCSSSTSTQKKEVEPGWPSVSNETKPWTRWWWLGSSVKDKDLTEAMTSYAEAGLGGLEITPIYGVKGLEDEFVDFTSSEWMDHLVHTLKTADSLGMGVDMALASGWPFGGPWVKTDDACKYVEFKAWKLEAGKKLNEKIQTEQSAILRIVGERIPMEDIKFPITENENLQRYAFDQVRHPKTLKPAIVMAYASDGEIFEVSDKVDEDGNLNWESPDKDWTIIATFPSLHGKMVERAGPGGEGDVIDHFSKKATNSYLAHFDKSFDGYDLSGLRAFFNDSYEVDDARGEANWTPEFYAEFQSRRGYDLKELLPALLGMTTKEEQQRVRCDFRATISEMLLENYTIPWQEWSVNKGKIIRNQGHGSPSNILDLYAASDIPETEGKDILNIKFAASAAHVSGKKLVAAEAATWLNEHFLANLADTKRNVDRYLFGGVNHIVYHGTPFSPEGEEWPGRMFYASVHYAPTNPLWRDFPAFNTYLTRTQSFLQRGTADNDILLYFPIYNDWMTYERSGLPHYHGAAHESSTYHLAEELQKEGYTYDYISDKQINKLSNNNDVIISEGNARYKTILVPEIDYIPITTLQKLAELANNGVKIIFMGGLPGDVSGLNNLDENRESLNTIAAEIKEKILFGDDHNALLTEAGVLPEPMAKLGLDFIRLNDQQTKTYFIANWSGLNIDGFVPLNTSAKSAIIYNPQTGVYGKAILDGNAVQLNIAQGESFILQLWNKDVNVEAYPYWSETDHTLALDSKWVLKFVEGGPTMPATIDNVALGSWTEFGQDAANFSGTAVYSTTFEKPNVSCDAWQLDLGKVDESAEVILNGESLGTLTGPIFSLEIDSTQLEAVNTLEVYVTNSMANRIIYMDKNELPYRNFYNINFAANKRENVGPDGKFTAANWEPLTSGLTGPVVLTSLNKQW